MSRLDNIIARNQRGGRPRERTVVMLVFGLCVLVIVGLLLFTDLGLPADPAASAPPPNVHDRDHRVDGVLLRRAR